MLWVMILDLLKLLVKSPFFLNFAFENDYLLFLEHDPINESCKLKKSDKGIQLDTTHNIIDFL